MDSITKQFNIPYATRLGRRAGKNYIHPHHRVTANSPIYIKWRFEINHARCRSSRAFLRTRKSFERESRKLPCSSDFNHWWYAKKFGALARQWLRFFAELLCAEWHRRAHHICAQPQMRDDESHPRALIVSCCATGLLSSWVLTHCEDRGGYMLL